MCVIEIQLKTADLSQKGEKNEAKLKCGFIQRKKFHVSLQHRSNLYSVWRSTDVQLYKMSKQRNCVFTMCFCGSPIQHHLQQTTVFWKETVESLRFCTKDLADMCCQPAQGLKAPPP